MHVTGDHGLPRVVGLALIAIAIAGVTDLILDRPESWLSFHVVFEAATIAGALLIVTVLGLHWLRAERAAARLEESLIAREAEHAAWQHEAYQALQGFGRAIDVQLRAWQLTPTEREVAILLLKGRSHKTIARLTKRSEATVRQHATSVYQKAHLSGRAELAAYFLEGIPLSES